MPRSAAVIRYLRERYADVNGDDRNVIWQPANMADRRDYFRHRESLGVKAVQLPREQSASYREPATQLPGE